MSTFHITYSACTAAGGVTQPQVGSGTQPITNVLKLNPVVHIFAGDYFYNDYAAPTVNGVTALDATFDRAGVIQGSTATDVYNHFNVAFGTNGLSQYSQFWQQRAAGKFKAWFVEDDHDGTWNNNDHTLASCQTAANFQFANTSLTFTASGATLTASGTHNMSVNNPVKFTTTGTLPAGLSLNTVYYVAAQTSTTFSVSATQNGTAITTTDGGSGTHTFTVQGVSTQSDVLWQWDIGQAGITMIRAQYADNTMGAPNGDIPWAMVGTADATHYKKKYFYQDFGPNGEMNLASGNVLRVIVPDWVSYKSPQGENESGTFTVTLANPAVFTSNGHGLTLNKPIQLTTTGTLPSHLSTGVTYYVTNPASNTFQLALTPGGTSISTLGDSQSGTHSFVNNTKRCLGLTQVNDIKGWLEDAMLKGIKEIVMASTKDLFNLDNGDGPYKYVVERDDLLTYIHTGGGVRAGGYPVIWLTGDRHIPHAGISRVSDGAAYDCLAVCACPFGSGRSSLTQYKQNVWSNPRNDTNVFGDIFVDTVAKIVRLSIIDSWSLETMFSATVPFGSRLPTVVTSSVAPVAPQAVSPVRTTGSQIAGNSPYTYKNQTNRPVQLIITGGTPSAAAYSRDNSTFDTMAFAVGTAYYILPGDFLKITYTGTLTYSLYPA